MWRLLDSPGGAAGGVTPDVQLPSSGGESDTAIGGGGSGGGGSGGSGGGVTQGGLGVAGQGIALEQRSGVQKSTDTKPNITRIGGSGGGGGDQSRRPRNYNVPDEG